MAFQQQDFNRSQSRAYLKPALGLSEGKVLFFAFICLLAGHLLIKKYFASPFYWVLGLLIIAGLHWYVLVKKNDRFSYILLIFMTSQVLNFFILILVVFDLVGLFFYNPSSMFVKIEGLLVFSAFIFMLYFIKATPLNHSFFKKYISVLCLLFCYGFILSLNQRFLFINLDTPLFPLKGTGATTTNSQGFFANSELFAEYLVMNLAFFLSLARSDLSGRYYNSRRQIYIILVLCTLTPFLTGSRSAVILMIIIWSYFVFFSLLLSNKIRGLAKMIGVLVVVGAITLVAGKNIGIKSTQSDFSQLHQRDFSVENIISGEALNRETVFSFGYDRLKSNSWFVGYGYGPVPSNQQAWFGPYYRMIHQAGFHSLYLSLPMIYGWLGSISLLLIILYVIVKNIKAMTTQARLYSSWKKPLFNGLLFMWFIFIVDEYKISMLRDPYYHMLIFILLGINYSLLHKDRSRDAYISSYTHSRKP